VTDTDPPEGRGGPAFEIARTGRPCPVVVDILGCSKTGRVVFQGSGMMTDPRLSPRIERAVPPDTR